MGEQLPLFGPEPDPPPKARRRGRAPVATAPVDAALLETAHRVPEWVRMGTSSWSFSGWAGIVYNRSASSTELARTGLEAYAGHPLLRTVGIDRTYYAPVEESLFRDWAHSVPSDFRFLVKAPETTTLPRFPDHPRYGDHAGKLNPEFLNPEWATEWIVGPMTEGLGDRAGPLVFQFSPMELRGLGGIDATIDRLYRFLSALPKGPLYAVELRNVMLLCERYVQALRTVGAVHCFNVHPTMPDIHVQRRIFEPQGNEPWVVRWMLRRGLRYREALDRYDPFDRLVDPDVDSRHEIAEICAERSSVLRPAFIVVNNKAEGSAPKSIFELAREVAGRSNG